MEPAVTQPEHAFTVPWAVPMFSQVPRPLPSLWHRYLLTHSCLLKAYYMPGNIPGIINIAVEEKANKPTDKKYCFGAYILAGDWRRQPKRKNLKTKSYSR